jgi:galactoside 2-L-fucosyltransferase 1/2
VQWHTHSDVIFFVASDDLEWCKVNLKGADVVFSPGLPAEEDFATLVECDHIIISSGTFGWWAAWLNGGVVLYYKKLARAGSPLDRHLRSDPNFMHNYFEPSWIGL